MYTLYTVLEYTNNIEYLNNTNDITNPGNPINGNDTMLLRLRFSQYYVYSCLLRTESELATVVVPLVGLSASILKTLLFMSKVILPLIM